MAVVNFNINSILAVIYLNIKTVFTEVRIYILFWMVDLHPSNLNPNTNDTMGTMISTTLNTRWPIPMSDPG